MDLKLCILPLTLQNDAESSLNYVILDMSFEAFVAAIFKVEVCWVVTPCSTVLGYHVSEVHAPSTP